MKTKHSKKTAAKILTYDQAESAVAIAMCFGQNKRLFNLAYPATEPEGGFPTFYQLAIKAGVALDEEGEKQGVTWGNAHDWLLSVEETADAILQFMADQGACPYGEGELTSLLRFHKFSEGE